MVNCVGRPSEYTIEIAKKVCDAIATNAMGLKVICNKFPDLPRRSTIMKWLGLHKEFVDMYIKAKEIQAHLLLDETIDIANDDYDDNLIKINRAKIKIDTYKFNAVRLNPRFYAERIKNDNSQKISIENAEQRVRDADSKYKY